MNEKIVSIPQLSTARLKLREHRLDDFLDFKLMWVDPVVTKFIGGKPSTEQQSWSRLLTYRGHWEIMGFGYWAIEEKSSRKYIGDLGFADFKREIVPSIAGIPEMGWALASPFHGQGYATEAMEAALVWAEAALASQGFKNTVCLISPENAASIRLAKKTGFNETHQTSYAGNSALLFSRNLI